MIIFIESLGWIGLVLLALQSGPQIIKLMDKNYQPTKEGKKPFYFLVIASITGVYYGLLLEHKIIYIGVANVIALFLGLLTIGIFILRTNKKQIIPFIIGANLVFATIVISTILFYTYNIHFTRWYLVVPLLILTIGLNIFAFLPYTIQAIKTKDMSQVSNFVLYNGFLMNLLWTINWALGVNYPEIAISSAPVYVFVIVIVFQSFGILFGAYQIYMWHKYTPSTKIKKMRAY